MLKVVEFTYVNQNECYLCNSFPQPPCGKACGKCGKVQYFHGVNLLFPGFSPQKFPYTLYA
jgi:hypothetical protein